MLTKKEKLSKLLRKSYQLVTRSPNKTTPIFIGGEQRSGTNFLTNVINSCNRALCYLENDDEAFNNYVLRDKDQLNNLIQKSRADITVFKSICDSQNISSLLADLPKSKAIWIFRNYFDVVNSSLRNFSEHKKYLYYILFEPKKAGWRLENVASEDLSLVKSFYTQGVDDASARALIWYLRNIQFYQQALDKNQQVLLIEYEEIVANPVDGFSQIGRFAGIKISGTSSTKLSSSSSVKKNTAPVIADSILALCEPLHQRLLAEISKRDT